jgi:aerobic carbon-monoxide dehydrogenase large subunit
MTGYLIRRVRYHNLRPTQGGNMPSGAHYCEVEIDAETGEVALTRYVAVDDVGRVLNPLLCEGQIEDGIVRGASQALMEDLGYGHATGQLLIGSFQDYAMPRADDFCLFRARQQPRPWQTETRLA